MNSEPSNPHVGPLNKALIEGAGASSTAEEDGQ